MAKFVIDQGDWVNEIQKKFGLAEKEVIPAMKMALYEGAKITADAVNRAADRNGVPWHCGISQHYVRDDYVETSVGYRNADYFYNRYDKKTPVDLVVNVMNSGSSKVKGNHFFDRACKSVKKLASGIMVAKFGQEISKIIGE